MEPKTDLKNRSVCVLGAGSWGTALGILLAKNGSKVTLWEFNKEFAEKLEADRENKTFLPGVRLPDSIKATNSLEEAVGSADYILFVVPSHVFRAVARNVAKLDVSNKKFITASKGIENESLMRMSEILLEEIDGLTPGRVAVLSGPSFAAEVSRDIPTVVVSASSDESYAKEIQKLFMCTTFRVYVNTDIVGVELGGPFKNVIAIAAGIIDGVGFADNTKAAMLTRAIPEMTRLGEKMGAKTLTFAGLSGIGDLILTSMGKLSRNLHVGQQIGKGRKLKEILDEMVNVAEGVRTTKSVHQLALRYNVETPIMEQVYRVLYEDKDPKKAIMELMSRVAKSEN